MGPGTWRLNPTVLDQKEFILLLQVTLDQFFKLNEDIQANPWEMWDQLKALIKTTTMSYTKGQQRTAKNRIAHLENMREKMSPGTELDILDAELEKLIENETQLLLLRTATRWHAQGERNNKYFFQVLKQRQRQQTIKSLRDAETREIYTSPSQILQHATRFYQHLYTPDMVNEDDIKQVTQIIPPNAKLPETASRLLCKDITVSDTEWLIKQSPKSKSPGLDGLPFELYQKLVDIHPQTIILMTSVINDALDGQIPTSWKRTRMTLLFKKGDAALLSNCRPLSLINTDAKIFTKMISNRLRSYLPGMITRYQTGFIKERLISDNGWAMNATMSHMQGNDPEKEAVGVFMDQEKAYDRVHPKYLQLVLQNFGFPQQIISTITQLFYETQVSVSINGWLGKPFHQSRGLRQGDPLSPLLFNLALEPLLRMMIQHSGISGIPWPKQLALEKRHIDYRNDEIYEPEPLKVLAYADDIVVFLQSPQEWEILLAVYSKYSQASNARMNIQKTALLSLSGHQHVEWINLARTKEIVWYDKDNLQPLTYLGYPLHSTQAQLEQFLDTVYAKLQRHVNFLTSRNLSIKGKAIVANSLLLSRLWHLLRVIQPPQDWLDRCREVSGFIYHALFSSTTMEDTV
jgi:hypothetical protein